MLHFFNPNVAAQYGVSEAVILNNIQFWLEKKKANNQDLYDGKYWTYNSMNAFKELFFYLSEKQIRRILDKLKKEGLIETGNYNKNTYDRTLWYTITDKGMELLEVDLKPTLEQIEKAERANAEVPNGADAKVQEGESICPNGQMELTKKANGCDQKGEPIPYINTYINTDSKPIESNACEQTSKGYTVNYGSVKKSQADAERQEYYFKLFWEAYPKKVNRSRARYAWESVPIDIAVYGDILRAVEAYSKSRQWQDKMYVPNAENFIADRRWEDEIPTEDTAPKIVPKVAQKNDVTGSVQEVLARLRARSDNA